MHDAKMPRRHAASPTKKGRSVARSALVGCGRDPQIAPRILGAYCTATETSSRTNEVASDESSVPENFSVIVLPMKLFRLIVRRT